MARLLCFVLVAGALSFACSQPSGSNSTGAGAPAPAPVAINATGKGSNSSGVPAPITASTNSSVDGNQQLAAFFAAGLSNATQNSFNIALTFTAPNGNLSANNATGRHLLQDVILGDIRDNSYTAAISIIDGNGVTQGGANGFPIVIDTGSPNVLVQGFNENGLTALATGIKFQFGGGNGGSFTVTSKEYQGTISFIGLPTTNAVAQFFSLPGTPSYPGPPLGLTFLPATSAGANPNPTPTLLTTLYQQGVISVPAFTLFLVDQSNPVPLPGTNTPGGQLGLGTAIPTNVPALQNTDVNCAPGVPRDFFGVQWTVAIQGLTATQGNNILGPNTVDFCPQGSGCKALFDSGNFEVSVPQPTLTAVFQLLGLGANPALSVTAGITGRASTYAPINCVVQTFAGPTLDFQIQDRVYSLDPVDYIFRYTTLANGLPIPANYAGQGFPPANGGPVCAVVLSASPQFPGSVAGYVLGDPFMAKFPGTFFGQGVIASTGSRGVPLSLGPLLGGGNNGNPEDDVCLYGTVPVKAVCMQPITLPVSKPLTCQATITSDALLKLVSLDNKVSGFVPLASTQQPMGPSSTVYTLQPSPVGGVYTFPGGTTQITLTATTPTTPTSVSSCVTSVNVPLVKPTAACAPALTLPATQGCAAHPSDADLKAAINAGSTPGSGGPLTVMLNTPAPAGGVYNLPVGAYPVSITVSNCAGTDTCSTLVTVSDQELLDGSKISCGALPTDGVVETPLLTKDKTTPVATYSPAYTKANGCPTTLITDNLSCRNCLVGSNKEQQGSWDHCDSSITSKVVNIFPEQIGRVAWTVTVEDRADHEATADCGICADHGDKTFTTLGHCPKPFTTATLCDFGNL